MALGVPAAAVAEGADLKLVLIRIKGNNTEQKNEREGDYYREHE